MPKRSKPKKHKVNEPDEKELRRKFDYVLLICFYVLALFLPLLISRITFEQFDLPKVVVLNIITQLMLLIWLMKMFSLSSTKIYRTKIDYFALALLLIMVIASIFAWDKPTAIFGKYRRYEGLITFIDYMLLLFLSSQIFRKFEQLRTLIKTLALVSFFVAIYGIIQYLVNDPLS